ncbi:MAG: serine/threonine protein kinase, partial [Planctomycetes bacterium]|nr:serine/threonine protein kinase [Planctomycetota bacterium]
MTPDLRPSFRRYLESETGDLESDSLEFLRAHPSLLVDIDSLLRSPDADPPSPPGYALEMEIARGGMGRIYLAHSTLEGERVALKFALANDADSNARLLEEGRTLRHLRHPGLVRYRDHGTIDGLAWLAMDWIEGKTLADWIEERRDLARIPLEQLRTCMGWFRELAEALHVLHTHGIVHRDIKPANILLRDDGPPCLVDFGLARQKDHPWDLKRDTSGNILELSKTPAASPNEIEVRNTLQKGAISACIYRDGKLLAKKTSVAPAQKAVFEFKPTNDPSPGSVEVFALGDLLRVHHRLLKYRLTDVATVECILPREQKVLANRRRRRISTESVRDRSEGRTREHDSTAGQEDLRRELLQTIAEEVSTTTYDDFKSTYGPPAQYTFDASWKVQRQSGDKPARSDRNRWARVLVDHAIGRAEDRVRELRTVSVTEEDETSERRVIDNRASSEALIAIHRWVAKLYRLEVRGSAPSEGSPGCRSLPHRAPNTAVGIEVTSVPTDELLAQWKVKAYRAIVSAARRQRHQRDREIRKMIEADDPVALVRRMRESIRVQCTDVLLQRDGGPGSFPEDPPRSKATNEAIEARDRTFLTASFEWSEMSYDISGRLEGFAAWDGLPDVVGHAAGTFLAFVTAARAEVLVPIRPERTLTMLYYLRSGTL